MPSYNIHAGHAAVGHGAIGAVSVLNESVEDRKIKDIVIKYLREMGNTVYDCTEDSGTASEVLSSIVRKCNAHSVDLDISIHFNAGANRPYCDGVTTGTEVYLRNPSNAAAKNAAEKIVKKLSALGFKNRGVKTRRDLYFLNKTKSPAILIEVCFVDDGDDAKLYNANIDKIGKLIAEGIADREVVEQQIIPKPENVNNGVYRLYNPNSGQHFFTISSAERDSLIDAGWGYEGVGWIAPESGKPVYRMYNPNSGEHFFTASDLEKDSLEGSGWNYEGISFFSNAESDSVPISRLYSGTEHFFSGSTLEIANLINLGWIHEGIAFYGA